MHSVEQKAVDQIQETIHKLCIYLKHCLKNNEDNSYLWLIKTIQNCFTETDIYPMHICMSIYLNMNSFLTHVLLEHPNAWVSLSHNPMFCCKPDGSSKHLAVICPLSLSSTFYHPLIQEKTGNSTEVSTIYAPAVRRYHRNLVASSSLAEQSIEGKPILTIPTHISVLD